MTQYGHAGQHHGIGTPDCPTDLHHHHDEHCDPLADRRQRAREAFWKHYAPEQYDGQLPALTDAIETATRVKIDHDMLADFARAWHEAPQDGPPGTRRRAGLAAAFRAAGFEVEE